LETQSTQPDLTPLCIDLDGTLVKLDTLHQALFLLLRRNPTALFSLPHWIQQGRAFTKNEVARRIALHTEHLPYNHALLDYLRQEKKNGRRIILVTAANYRTAESVAAHIGLFDEILASTETHNLFGTAKRDALVERFITFDYAGDSLSDLPVWQVARQKILVNPSHQARKAQPADLLIEDRQPLRRILPHMLRLHHWVKNLLIFSPLLLAHRLNDTLALTQALLAFIAFSLVASAIYIINDLLDLSADQTHPRKKHRPFAAGDLQLIQGVRLIPVLLLGSLLISTLLPIVFSGILLLYLLFTTLYSIWVKKLFAWDVLMLTGLYTLRIIAGGAATHTPVSAWLLAFSILFFLTLALAKRCTELKELSLNDSINTSHRERPYQPTHSAALFTSGLIAAGSSSLILIGYLLSDKVRQLYEQPLYLWGVLPLILYWFWRIWDRVKKGLLHDDPLVFAVSDLQTYCIGSIVYLLVYFAT
jgi:4-hydroxybenzoate polyprenyltransferase/phosphoserine phosphatase